ncbi:hypothetical protein BC937DRAFT_94904, partial [Endogone sp. FLAS-F59071]
PAGSHIVITDTLGADANFLLHHFIANQLKADGGTGKVVLAGLAHIFNHYAIVGKKLVGAIGEQGVNLQQAKQSHNLAFIDALTHLNRAPSSLPPLSSQPPIPSVPTAVLAASANLRSFYNTLYAALDGDRPLVILDDASVLLWSGYDVMDVVGFVRALRVLLQKRNGTLITLIHADEQLASDPAQDAFVPSVLGMADLVLSIQGLGSGFSKDVHGQLSIIHGAQYTLRIPSLTTPPLPIPQSVHYKILDNTVQFFARGISEGVL